MNNGFLRVFFIEWRKFFSNPKKMLWVLGVPLLIFLFFGSLLKKGVPQNLPVAVVDYSQTPLSRDLLQKINATPTIHFSKRLSHLKEAQPFLQRGDIYAVIVVPSDFEESVYTKAGGQVICYTNNQFVLPAGLIQKDFIATVQTFSAKININSRLQKGETLATARANIQSIHIDNHTLFNPYTNYNYYLNLALLPMMFQVLVMIISIYILGLVLKKQKGQKLYKLGLQKPSYIVLGKLLPYTLIFVFLAWVMDVYLFHYIGVPAETKSGEIFLIFVLLILVYQSLALFFVSFAPNLRSALTYGGGFSALAFSFSGYTFPMDGLPLPMQWMAQTFPFTHFLKSYINTSIRHFPLSESYGSLLALVSFFLFGIIAIPRFHQLLKKGGYENNH